MQIGSAAYLSSYTPLSTSLPARPVSADSCPDLARATQAPVTPVQSLDAPGDARTQSPPEQEVESPRGRVGNEEPSVSQRQREEQESRQIQNLAARDREVRNHEQAHAAVGGRYAGPPSFTYTRGPDGQAYATSGEVSIDVSPIPNDPEATLRKMELVQRAALAPAEPSAQDLRVAAQAQALAAQARAELGQMQREQLAAEQAARSEERQQAEEEEAASEEKPEKTEQSLPPPPSLELYRRLAALQEPAENLDIEV